MRNCIIIARITTRDCLCAAVSRAARGGLVSSPTTDAYRETLVGARGSRATSSNEYPTKCQRARIVNGVEPMDIRARTRTCVRSCRCEAGGGATRRWLLGAIKTAAHIATLSVPRGGSEIKRPTRSRRRDHMQTHNHVVGGCKRARR